MARYKGKPFAREKEHREIKKLFLLSAEGKVTEPLYFDLINLLNSDVVVHCVGRNKKHRSPERLLNYMKVYLSEEKPRGNYEAWLVIDRDNWSEEVISKLYNWSRCNKNYNFALSNPQFEYWLLLHFEKPKGIVTKKTCKEKIKTYLPKGNKSIKRNTFPKNKVEKAIKLAEEQDTPRCKQWPRTTGTTVYRLVESIIKGI